MVHNRLFRIHFNKTFVRVVVGKVTLLFGWFWGEDWKLFGIDILQYLPKVGVTVIDLTLLKFSVEVHIDL